jgi:O-antigen/teichoic acid export membrane protein
MRDKLKELTKDTAIYGISTIIGRFLGFLLTPFYTNVLLPGDYGIFSNVYAYIAFINILFIYGMDAAYMKFASVSEDVDRKRKVFSTSYLFVTGTSLLFCLVLYFVMNPMKSLMELPDRFESIYFYFIGILLLDTLALIPFADLRLKRKAAKFSAIKFGNILVNLTLNFVLVLKYNMGIEAIFIANIIASLFSFVLLLPEIIQSLNWNIDKEILNKLIKFGLPYLPGSIAAMIVQVIDRPVVLALTDEKTLGIYQANYKLGIFMMLFVSMFQQAWQPFFLINAKEKNAKELFSKILTLFVLISSLIWIILTLFVEDFARFEFLPGKSIIGKEYLSGIIIVPIILLGYLFNGMYYNFQAGIYIEEKTKYFPYVTFSGALANVAVNVLLIPKMGVIGAAIATLASYIIMAGGLYYFSQKYYRIEYETAKIARLLTLVLISCGLYYYLYFEFGITLLQKIVFLLVFMILLLLLKIIQKEELIKIVKTFLRIKR